MDIGPGSVLADYEIVSEIGRGGMGVVYEAVQLRLKRRVALKVLPQFYAASTDAVLRFRREAEAGARLRHPNIVQVHEVGQRDEVHFIAMELVTGSSLAAEITNALRARNKRVAGSDDESKKVGALTATTDRAYIEGIVRIMIGVLRGLEHAHSHGVVHRDIKPQNLLIDDESRVLIADFGLARVLEDPALSAVGDVHGTPWYMSPEQVAVGTVPIDHRTDVFSTGATLYEALTLDRPFPGRDVTTIFRGILHKNPRAPRDVNPRLSRDLETITLKALEKDPDRRYQTAAEFADDLERFLNYETIRARPVGPVRRMLRTLERNKLLTGLSALLAVVLIAGSAYALAERARRIEQIETGLAVAAAHREAGNFQEELRYLQALPRTDEVEALTRDAAGRCRAEADRLIATARRLLLEQRFDRARVALERAQRLAPGDPEADRLYEEAAGVGTVEVHVEGAPARVLAAEYVQLEHRFEPAVEYGRTAEHGVVSLRLRHGDYLVCALRDDGVFAEAWVAIDRDFRDQPPIRLRPIQRDTEGMVRMRAGSYPIGEDGVEHLISNPRHVVALESFWIDAKEVTNRRYDRFVQYLRRTRQPLPALEATVWPDGEFDERYADLPKSNLTWLQACRFLAFEGKRLPTEAEWEAACRGAEGLPYPWGERWDAARANVGSRTPRPVGTHGAFLHGLYDMVGNEGEWTADRFLPYAGYSTKPLEEAMARAVAEAAPVRLWEPVFDPRQRVTRGGSYRRPPRFARGTMRDGQNPGSAFFGMRGVRSVAPRVRAPPPRGAEED